MNIEQSNRITVITQNVLLDKTREKNDEIYSQDERIDAMATSFLDSELSLDVVGIQEAHDNAETGQHNGKRLAAVCGFEDSYWQQHNRKPYKGSSVGRAGEHIGLFGSRVDHAEAIDLGDRRKALLTSIAGVAFVTLHWRARPNASARQSRQDSAERLLDALNTYDNAVVLGDFNEPNVPLFMSGKKMLHTTGFVSVFASMGMPQPRTFPTKSYRGITSEMFGRWPLDDILTRGDRVRVLDAGTIAQVAIDNIGNDRDVRPIYPSDHLGLWSRLDITSE